MGKFIENEKINQTNFKIQSSYFSDQAKRDGIYKGKQRSFCLPVEYAEENLYFEIRDSAIEYFKHSGIKWHDGHNFKPSNHLCDSQVSCVNFLFPFFDKPEAMIELFLPIFPDIKEIIPMENLNQFISFEWIGKENYLNERVAVNSKRTRGANFTSSDAALMFENKNGERHIVLIEWKYTESYSSYFLKISKHGTDRTKIYYPLFNLNDCPINKSELPDFDALFYEPFYQLMRHQFLAHEMEKAEELGAKSVSVLHISPSINNDLGRITSPKLLGLGVSVTDVWKKILIESNKFKSIFTEKLFDPFPIDKFPELKSWWDYLKERYSWTDKLKKA